MQEETIRQGRNGVFLLALIAALVFLAVRYAQKNGLEQQTEPAVEQVSPDTENTFSSELPGVEYEFAPPSETQEKVTIDERPSNKALKTIPDLSRPIPNSVRPSTKTEMERIIAEIRKDPSNATLWLDLGLYRKESDDYAGARQAWEYALALQPENTVIADNLGVLYGYYLKNGLKSEEFFRAAIVLEPQNIHLRLRLFELYRDVFGDKVKARTSIENALKDNPGDEQLTALLKEMTSNR